MKILIPIDQKGSLAAGIEAPNSTEIFDLPIGKVPEMVRLFIVDRYNPATYKLADPAARLVLPLTEQKVIAWLVDYNRRQKEIIGQEEKEAKERQERIAEAAAKVLASRTTTTRFDVDDDPAVAGEVISYEYEIPAWPYLAPESITGSPEAMKWQKELAAAKEKARQTAIRQAQRFDREIRQKQEVTDRWIADWVALHGTKSQQERHEAGMLPKDEIKEAILKQIVPFPRVNDSDVIKEDALNSIPPKNWNTWKKVKETVPGITSYNFMLIRLPDKTTSLPAVGLTIEIGPLDIGTVVLL